MLVIYYAHPITVKPNVIGIDKESFHRRLKETILGVNTMVVDPAMYDLDDKTHGSQIVRRNKVDILASAVVVADFTSPSTGVAGECAFAKANGIPVIGLANSGSKSAWVDHLCDIVAYTQEGVVMALKMKLQV